MHLPSALPQHEAGDTAIDRSVQTWNYVCQSLCIFGMSASFGLRLYTWLFTQSGSGKEDCASSIAWLLGVCYSVVALIMGHYGGSLHYYNVPIGHRAPFEKTVYVAMVIYGPTAYLTKVCLLWIMTRVFRPVRKAVLFIYIFRGVMLAYYIPAVIVKIRICSPIAKFWDTGIDGTCLDETSIILADAVVSAGGFAVEASIIRLALMVVSGQLKDVTLSFMRINMLGNAEVSIGVICTSLPTLSPRQTHPSPISSMKNQTKTQRSRKQVSMRAQTPCLLYTSDAADEMD